VNQKTLRQIVELEPVERAQLTKIFNHTYRPYAKRMEYTSTQQLTIWTSRVESLEDARKIMKLIMRTLKINTITKDSYNDMDLILNGKLGFISVNIWIPIPKAKSLDILSEYFNCQIVETKVQHKAYESSSIGCLTKQ